MNKDWDKAVVSVDIWKECLRVLKPGAFAFIMSSPRQDVLAKMILNLIDAGFETNFSSIYWCYSSGFPKASNSEVVLRKRYATKSQTQMCQLWKTIIKQTPRIENNNDWRSLQTLLAYLEQGTQHEIHAYTRGQIESATIPERLRQSCLEGWGVLSQTSRELCLCQVCKMPIGLYFNGKERRLCYGAQIDNGSVTWQTTDENGMRASYQSQAIRQSFGELDVICDQCITQKIRDSNLSGSFLGFQPKPAVEIILVVMKPLSQKTYVDQALANGKGITWLDDCRIPYQNEDDKGDVSRFTGQGVLSPENGWNKNSLKRTEWNVSAGRFPANLLVSDDVLNDGRITGAGITGSGIARRKNVTHKSLHVWGKYKRSHEYPDIGYNDSGSYSRYFDLDRWFETTFPFIITPKPSKHEKDMGLDKWIQREDRQNGFSSEKSNSKLPLANTHPTVKSIKLMSYLITLGSRENDTVLDPFAGSGTTCIAAKMLQRKYIGIELNEEYAAIAKQRLNTKKQISQLLSY